MVTTTCAISTPECVNVAPRVWAETTAPTAREITSMEIPITSAMVSCPCNYDGAVPLHEDVLLIQWWSFSLLLDYSPAQSWLHIHIRCHRCLCGSGILCHHSFRGKFEIRGCELCTLRVIEGHLWLYFQLGIWLPWRI